MFLILFFVHVDSGMGKEKLEIEKERNKSVIKQINRYLSYTSVFPKICGFASRDWGSNVTTANGSDVPLNDPATLGNLVARMEICTLSFVILNLIRLISNFVLNCFCFYDFCRKLFEVRNTTVHSTFIHTRVHVPVPYYNKYITGTVW